MTIRLFKILRFTTAENTSIMCNSDLKKGRADEMLMKAASGISHVSDY